jgi:uncharacterized damage-inducible protein DinB
MRSLPQSGQMVASFVPQAVAMTTKPEQQSTERNDLVETLTTHRSFLKHTVRDLSDEQASLRTTASTLCLGGLIKHVTLMEQGWTDFIERGPEAKGPPDQAAMESYLAGFRMVECESLALLLDAYEKVACRTDTLVSALPSLDASHPLPEAPWFERGAQWSARRVILHVIAETAQHAGHADIIRESLDGAKTMG